MMERCNIGTSSCMSSTPRSPRATMMPSDSAMISSSDSMAEGFSILAIRKALSPTRLRSSTMSLGFWTKERATQSTPMSSAAVRSALSLTVSAETGTMIVGRLTPFLSESFPPTSTFVSTQAPPGSVAVTTSLALPSSIRTKSPIERVCMISWCGNDTRVSSPNESTSRSSLNFWPFCTTAYPSSNLPILSLGPWRSAMMPMACLYLISSLRMSLTTSCFSSWAPCEKFMRKTSAVCCRSGHWEGKLVVMGPAAVWMPTSFSGFMGRIGSRKDEEGRRPHLHRL